MSGRELLSSTTRGANHQRDGALSAKHGVDFRGVIDDLIHGQHNEIDGHDLHNGAKAQHRGASSHANKPILSNGGIYHAFGTELLKQTSRDFIRAFEGTDLLAH